MTVSYDILLHILRIVHEDGLFDVLAQCSRVGREFHLAAASYLYARVILSPKSEDRVQLDLSRRNQKLNGLFESACLSYYAVLVVEVVVSGWLLTTPSPRNKFSAVLQTALQTWPNARIVTLTPHVAPKELMDVSLSALNLHSLLRLTVNAAFFSDETPQILLTFTYLVSLTIVNPTRATLQILPLWLHDLSTTLTTFQLMDNCGSVTPGVLRSFIPSLTRVQTFGMGLSYSLTNDDMFAFLEELPQINCLDLRYYAQLRKPERRPCLSNLHSFNVRFPDMHNWQEIDHLVKWIRRISSRSPLASVRLLNDDRFRTFSSVSYDGLLDHLGSKHGETLHSVKLEGCTVGKKSLQEFCRRCKRLENLTTSVRHDILWDLPELSELRFVLLTTPHVERPWHIDHEDARVIHDIFRRPSRLRRLGINKHRWTGDWQAAQDGSVDFVIQRSSIPKPHSWEESLEHEWRCGKMLYDM